MRLRIGILSGFMAAVLAVPVMAAPLIQLSLVGRVVGGPDPTFHDAITVTTGQQVEYRLFAQMAPLQTSNTQGATTRTITSLALVQGTSGDGINGLKIDLFNRPGSLTTTAFTAGGTLNPDPSSLTGDGWDAGTGASGGTPTASDLLGVRPIHSTGLQTFGNPELVMSGLFTVPAGGLGLPGFLDMRWAAGGAGSAKINGGTNVIISATTEAGADPFVGYTPLAMNVPEPGTAGLLGLGLLGAFVRRRRA